MLVLAQFKHILRSLNHRSLAAVSLKTVRDQKIESWLVFTVSQLKLNRAARIITGSGWDVRSAQILCALKWESPADWRSKQLKSLMFKTANNLAPEYLSDKFTSVNTIHRHNLRGTQHNLFIPRPNTEALKKGFRYRGALTWNGLSVEAKQVTTLNSFYSAIEC